MYNFVFIPVVGLIIAIGIVVIVLRRSKKRSKGIDDDKTQELAFKRAVKHLVQNPRDPESLSIVADVYFKQGQWKKAFHAYALLNDIAITNRNLNKFEIELGYGLSALQLGDDEEAYRGFNAAWAIRQDNHQVNYNMGYLEFQRNNYDKAIQYLFLARKLDPEHPLTLRYLGHSFFKLLKYKEAVGFIQQAVELTPEDKESLYILGECYYHLDNTDQALRIFAHLRSDPGVGANASLFSGIINRDMRKGERAIEDFEIGLRHENIKPDILLELRYNLAKAYLDQNDIKKALPLLGAIKESVPVYKDVDTMIKQYEELNANQNLQTFMLAPSADFVALCRKVVMNYYFKAKVKISNILVSRSEWVDITAEIETSKWSDIVAFRFIRTEGAVGELVVRDFHSHVKDVKAGRGICLTVGKFSDEAIRYTEARLIDLIEKNQLIPILHKCE